MSAENTPSKASSILPFPSPPRASDISSGMGIVFIIRGSCHLPKFIKKAGKNKIAHIFYRIYRLLNVTIREISNIRKSREECSECPHIRPPDPAVISVYPPAAPPPLQAHIYFPPSVIKANLRHHIVLSNSTTVRALHTPWVPSESWVL